MAEGFFPAPVLLIGVSGPAARPLPLHVASLLLLPRLTPEQHFGPLPRGALSPSSITLFGCLILYFAPDLNYGITTLRKHQTLGVVFVFYFGST